MNNDESYDKGLIHAAREGQSVVVNRLLDNKANVNGQHSNGNTALTFAVQNQHWKVANLLLNCKEIDVNLQGKEQWSVIMYVSQMGCMAVVHLLLDNKANVNYKDETGYTALMAASTEGHPGVVDKLLKCKACVNQQSKCKETALLCAARSGKLNVVNRLLEHREIDVNLQDKNGWTALMWASRYEHLDVVNRLLNYLNAQIHEGFSLSYSRNLVYIPEDIIGLIFEFVV